MQTNIQTGRYSYKLDNGIGTLKEIREKSKMATEADDSTEARADRLMSSFLEDALAEKDHAATADLDDCIEQVLETNGRQLKEKNEATLKMAATFSNALIGQILTSNATWKKFAVFPGKYEKTATLHNNDFGSFLCQVHLKRPTRLAAFVFQGGRLPSMYCKVKVNPRDSNEQQMSVLQEWRECTDKDGYLRPDMIMQWFNKGLLEGKRKLLKETQKWTLSHLVTASGAIMMSVTGSQGLESKSENDTIFFNVKFVPCIDWVKVPNGMVTLPTSPCEPFPRIKRRLLNMVKRASKRDRCPITLTAWNPKYTETKPQWRLSFIKYEREILNLFEDPDFPCHTKDLMVLVESMVLAGSVNLSALTRQLLLQALLNTMARFQYERQTRPFLFICLLESLKTAFSGSYMRQMLIPSISALKDGDRYEMERTAKGLGVVLKDTTKNPEMLLVHLGLRSRLETLTEKFGYR